MVEEIANEIIARKLPLIVDVRDESTTDVRVVLEIKPDASPEAVMAYLYKHTGLQTNFNVNLTCLTPTTNPAVGQPARVTLRDLCQHFLDLRMIVVTRRLEHEKKKLLERLHILAALAKIYDDLDRAIRIIRKSESRADAAEKLMKEFKLDQMQADAVLEIRLYQLARLEIEKIRAEMAEKKKRLKEIEALLAKPKERWKLIRAELTRIDEKFGDKRRTTLRRRRRGARVRPRGLRRARGRDRRALARRLDEARPRGEGPDGDAAPRRRRARRVAAGVDARSARAVLVEGHGLRDAGRRRAGDDRLRRAGAVAA